MKKWVVLIYSAISMILFLNIICYLNFNISLRGYWTDRILFWIWIALTIFLIIKFWRRKLIKIYLSALIVATILSMIPMLIPFLIIISTITGQDIECLQNLNSTIRIQEKSASPVVSPKIEIIKKSGLIERIIGERDFQMELEGNYYRMCEANSIEIVKSSLNEVNVKFIFDEGDINWKIRNTNY